MTLTLIRRDSFFFRVLSKFFFIPKGKNIALDEMGSWVWKRCDGVNSVEKIIMQMSDEFKLSRKEAEVSLMSFLKSLSRKRLIGFVLNKKTE